MDRHRLGRLACFGLALLLGTVGCRSMRPEVPPERSYSPGTMMPSAGDTQTQGGFSQMPHTPMVSPTAPTGAAPGAITAGQAPSFGTGLPPQYNTAGQLPASGSPPAGAAGLPGTPQ